MEKYIILPTQNAISFCKNYRIYPQNCVINSTKISKAGLFKIIHVLTLMLICYQEQTTKAWVMEVRSQKEIFIIASFDHFTRVTNEFDLLLPPRFPCRKDAQKPLLFGTWSREGLSPGGKTSPQLEQPRLKNLYTVLPITNQQQLSQN